MIAAERCQEILDIVQTEARAAGVADIEVLIGACDESLTRFANNAIHQNVSERAISVSIRPQHEQRTARVSTNRTDADSLRAATRDAIALMRAQNIDERLLSLNSPTAIEPVDRYDAATASATPAQRARIVAAAIEIARQAGQTAAGICSTEWQFQALLNSAGLFATHAETHAVFSITAMSGSGSGWAKRSGVSLEGLGCDSLARSASRKAHLSQNPRAEDPGSWTVILEPAAVLDLVGQMMPDFAATALEDQRSFLMNRLGERLFGSNITIHDDVRHPLQTGAPFDGEGVPRQRIALVENGVPLAVCYSRGAAHRAGVEPTGHGLALPNEIGEYPANVAIAGGTASLEDMIRSTRRGILVTRLWYIREVDPYEKIMTGMTRDGTFLVENGEPVTAIRNFRFNQSIIELLASAEMLGEAVRASGEETYDMVVPSMKATMNFTEATA